MDAKKEAHKLEAAGVEPIAEYVAAAGPDWGWVKVWQVDGGGYLVYWTDNHDYYAVVEDSVDIEDLAAWLEWDNVNEWEAIEQRANVRGADAIPNADEDDKGPYYVLMTRHWYGATETSSLIKRGREPLEFETIEEAQEWIKAADDCVYLAHNESGRPSYKVVSI